MKIENQYQYQEKAKDAPFKVGVRIRPFTAGELELEENDEESKVVKIEDNIVYYKDNIGVHKTTRKTL